MLVSEKLLDVLRFPDIQGQSCQWLPVYQQVSLNEVVVDYLRNDELVRRASDDRNDPSFVRGGKELPVRVSPPSRIARIGPSLIDCNS